MTSIGKKRPDLILLDYEMPVCDGRMTLEMIRAEEGLCDIPVKEVLIQKIEEVFHKEQ